MLNIFNRFRRRLIMFLIGKDIMVLANVSIPLPLYLNTDNIPKAGGVVMRVYGCSSVQTVRTQWESEKLELKG